MTPSSRPSFATASGVPTDWAMASAIALISRTCSVLTAGCNARTAAEGPAAGTGGVRQLRNGSAGRSHRGVQEVKDRVDGAFANPRAAGFDAAHPALGRERNEVGADLREITPADAVFLLCEHHDGTALRRLVGERCQLGCIRQLL